MNKNKKVSDKNPLVSIIIRTKNEERWITLCLNAVFSQSYKNFEVIIIDNNSTDSTLARLKEFSISLLSINEFFPGLAINKGIKKSKGEIIVCLSGHCIPTNKNWLENLIKDIEVEGVAGIYGRQEPLSYSSDTDKRDLINLFGIDKKIQIKDPFFHNANSAFKKSIWKKFKFDEKLTNIEDRDWGQRVIRKGYRIIYEPMASVYHWHGVHHNMSPDRAKNVVKVLESIDASKLKNIKKLKRKKLVYALIPIKGQSISIDKGYLIDHTLNVLLKSKKIDKVFVITDNKKTADHAKKKGAIIPFLRPKYLSSSYISIGDVIQYSIDKILTSFPAPDYVGVFEEVYPFRNLKIVDGMIGEIVNSTYDTLIAAKYEPRGIFINNKDKTDTFVERFMPSKFKENKMYVGLLGLGCILKTDLVLTGEILGKNVGLYEINNPFSHLSIKTKIDLPLFEQLAKSKKYL